YSANQNINQPAQNSDQQQNLNQLQQIQNLGQQNYNQHQVQNLAQQSYLQQSQQQQIQNYAQHAHQQTQSYRQYNQNSDNVMVTTLPRLNLNISSPNNIHHGIKSDNDPLILRISDRLLMIKDCIMTMNQHYAELEQDFCKLRRRYD
ncbi:4599_t:CDS:1, partial [Entrophospora sp. SA101]